MFDYFGCMKFSEHWRQPFRGDCLADRPAVLCQPRWQKEREREGVRKKSCRLPTCRHILVQSGTIPDPSPPLVANNKVLESCRLQTYTGTHSCKVAQSLTHPGPLLPTIKSWSPVGCKPIQAHIRAKWHNP